MEKIIISTEFSPNLGGRYKRFGEFSGEEFYQDILEPKYKKAIDAQSKLLINLDGASPYGSSFLDESFGALMRKFGLDNVSKNIEFQTSNYKHVVDLIKQRIWIENEKK